MEKIDEIDSVELNYLVHEKIFGHTKPNYVYMEDHEGLQFGWNTPNYSGDIKSAWKIIDHLKDKIYTSPTDEKYQTAPFVNLEYFNGEWVVRIQGKIPSIYGGMGVGSAKSITKAICRAALKSIGLE